MLCKYAGIVLDNLEKATKDAQESYNYVLKMCGGLPVALRVAGKAVGRIAGGVRNRVLSRGTEYALVQYRKMLE